MALESLPEPNDNIAAIFLKDDIKTAIEREANIVNLSVHDDGLTKPVAIILGGTLQVPNYIDQSRSEVQIWDIPEVDTTFVTFWQQFPKDRQIQGYVLHQGTAGWMTGMNKLDPIDSHHINIVRKLIDESAWDGEYTEDANTNTTRSWIDQYLQRYGGTTERP